MKLAQWKGTLLDMVFTEAPHLEDGRRQGESGDELACQVGKVDEAPHVSLLCLLELIPQAVLQGDSVRFAGSQQALQQVHIVWVPATLLQAALHCDSDHLPLCLPLHCIALHHHACCTLMSEHC